MCGHDFHATRPLHYLQTTKIGILREVRESDAAGKIHYVLATAYPDMLRRLVQPGSHAFIGEDLTGRVLMAQQFSETGKA